MSDGPRRLLVDPDFKWETGCDLADEALAVGGYDLEGMKAAVVAGTTGAGGAAAASSGGLFVKAAVVTVLATSLVGAFLLGRSLSTTPAPQPADVPTEMAEHNVAVAPPALGPAIPAANERPAPTSDADAETDDDGATQVVVASPSATAPAAAHEAAVAELNTDDGDAVAVVELAPALEIAVTPVDDVGNTTVIDVEPPEEVPQQAPVSQLTAQLERFESGREAMTEGRYGEALDLFRSYTVEWPDGALRGEALLAELEIEAQLGRWTEVESLAMTLLKDSSLASRSSELVLARADALVALGRCTEALDFLDERGERSARAAAVRRTCRRLNRGD